MNILILNWRDIKNPESGGAEVLTHEMAKRWVGAGHRVVQFSAMFKGATHHEEVDGVEIIRRGSADIRSFSLPVQIAAYLWYKKLRQGHFDAVIDEIHGIPFFTPWYVSGKKVALICEVADKIWNATFSFPLNIIGRSIEKYYFRFYNNIPFLTISPSTRDELTHMGVPKKHITVLPMGVNVPKRFTQRHKEKKPTLIFVARLTRAKGMENALDVVSCVAQAVPTVRLWVLGQGSEEYMKYIRQTVEKRKMNSSVTFFGYVSQEKKFELMGRAHALIAPSMKEGWGLTVPEAGCAGTPAVGYSVEGLRDVIVHGTTGLLTDPHPEAMSQKIVRLLGDKNMYRKLQSGAKRLALSYSWDKTAAVGLSVLHDA